MSEKVPEYRGFAAECAAESRGEPVYPIWRDLPANPPKRR